MIHPGTTEKDFERLAIVVDGVAFDEQRTGGIPRMFAEILPRICEFDSSAQIDLLLSRPASFQIDRHPRLRLRRLLPVDRWLRPGRLFGGMRPGARKLAQRLSLHLDSTAIWHSSYYTEPPQWRGKHVVTVFDLIYERFPLQFNRTFDEQLRRRKRRVIESADAVICISETTRQDVLETFGIPGERAFTVPLAASPVFSAGPTELAPMSAPERPFFLYVGGRSHYKNFWSVLSNWKTWKRRTELDLVVVGRPWTLRERKELHRIGMERCTRVLSHVSDCQLADLYRRASALVYPSLYEGFGIPLLEAMASGCPIVASRIPSTVEVAGEYPVYFDVTSGEEMLSALDTALGLRIDNARAAWGRTHASNYTWEKAAEATLGVYRYVDHLG